MYRQRWSFEINQSTRSTFYKELITKHEYCNLLRIIDNKKHRISVTKLIMSSHRLHIETGRWTRPVTQRQDRLCETCPGHVEDEYHVILECNRYNEMRSRFIPRYYRTNPSMWKLVTLFNATKPKVIRSLAKFIHLIMSAY